jgi:asparaginyl-tRNA synthetase
VDYTDAVTILENCGEKFENPVYWGVDLFRARTLSG